MRIAAWDGIRFFLFIGVMSYHYFYEWVQYLWYLNYCLFAFFVISGFLITEIVLRDAGKPRGPMLKNFYVRRALRIFPAYFTVLFVAMYFQGIPYAEWAGTYLLNIKIYLLSISEDPQHAIQHFLSWRTNGTHLWSMSVEEQFYLFYPPFILWLTRKGRIRTVVAALVASIAARVAFIQLQPLAFYGALPIVAGEYVLWGCLFAILHREGKLRFFERINYAYPAFAGLALFTYLEGRPEGYNLGVFTPGYFQSVYAVLITVFVYSLRLHQSSALSRFLSLRPFVYAGNLSYGMYLWHMFFWFLPPLVYSQFESARVIPAWLIMACATFGAASLMWHIYEDRINRLRKTFQVP